MPHCVVGSFSGLSTFRGLARSGRRGLNLTLLTSFWQSNDASCRERFVYKGKVNKGEKYISMETLKNYVRGEQVEVEAGEHLDVPDPATGEVLAQVPLSGETDVDWAVRVAAEAF